jgi:asparagine synthase (glutamine-hydrolysing)
MCGICGFTGDNNKQILRKMCDIIEYRGPDDSGTFEDRGISLGNRRLSIIGLGTGHQPVHNEDKSVWVTYNGEIYNYKTLRDELVSSGHKFYTDCDTEVIVHAYEEYGENCVSRFRGMFGFALWDMKKKQLLLARDRFGIKPLYYSMEGGELVFGSEIKSILIHPSVKTEADSSAMSDFLTLRYVPGEKTFFRGVSKILPGHVLTWKNGNAKVSRYWQANFEEDQQVPERDFLDGFRDAVQSHLMSEVPLGVFLSGGMDSSSIVAIMSQITDQPIKTFSVGFGDEKVDETPYARQVAEHFHTDHHEFIAGQDSMKLLPKILWHIEEPNADPAAIPLYILSEGAKKHVTVVLVGEGGDEVLGGYQHYNFISMKRKYGAAMKLASPFVGLAPKSLLDRYFKFASGLGEEGMKRFEAFAKAKSYDEAYYLLTAIFTEDEKKELLRLKFDTDVVSRLYSPYFAQKKNFTACQLFDINNWLTHLLTKADKVTMAHSLESRVPFLDNTFFDMCAKTLPDQRLHGSKGKWILRHVMTPILPKGIGTRKKHQFFVPTDKWLGDVKGAINEYLSEETIRRRGYFNAVYLNKIINGYNSSKIYYSRQLWNLITLETWHRVFIDVDWKKSP